VGGSLGRLLQCLLLGPWIAMILKKYIRIVALKPNKDLAYMNELYEAGKIRSVIDGPYKLEDATDVFRIFAKGGHKGKMVITL
jgi:NADPH:quinone reductase-like Zn-dependent oxidoreductase